MLLARRKTYAPAANTVPGISTGWSNVTIVFLSHSSAFAFDGNNVINIATPIIAIAIRNVFIVYLQIILIRFFRQPASGKAVVGQDRGLLTQIYVGGTSPAAVYHRFLGPGLPGPEGIAIDSPIEYGVGRAILRSEH